jgi:hypothetical protein
VHTKFPIYFWWFHELIYSSLPVLLAVAKNLIIRLLSDYHIPIMPSSKFISIFIYNAIGNRCFSLINQSLDKAQNNSNACVIMVKLLNSVWESITTPMPSSSIVPGSKYRLFCQFVSHFWKCIQPQSSYNFNLSVQKD